MRSKRQGNYIVYYDDNGKEISRRLATLNLPGGAFSGYSDPKRYTTPNQPHIVRDSPKTTQQYDEPANRGSAIVTPPNAGASATGGTGYNASPENVYAADSGGGGGSNAGTGGDNVVTDAVGNLSQLVKDAQLSTAWENPEALINLYARQVAGLDPSGGGEATLQKLAPSLGILWMIMQDQAGKGGLGSDIAGSRDYVNWVEPNLDAMRNTAGGSILSNPGSILSTLMDPTGETLQTYLGAGGEGAANLSRTDQVDNMINAARYGLEPTLPTPTLNSLLNILSVKGRQYVADQLTGQTEGSFPELMRQTLGM